MSYKGLLCFGKNEPLTVIVDKYAAGFVVTKLIELGCLDNSNWTDRKTLDELVYCYSDTHPTDEGEKKLREFAEKYDMRVIYDMCVILYDKQHTEEIVGIGTEQLLHSLVKELLK